MTYRATVSSALGLYVIGAVFAGLLLAIGFLLPSGSYAFVLAGVVVIVSLVAIRVRCLVRVSPEELRARNLVGERGVKWRNIVRVAPAVESGYWAGRLFGPAVVEFATPSSRVRVNFKLFPVECLRDVLEHIPQGVDVGV